MAQLALAAAGAVVGGFIGGPAGASVGWTLGSVGGAMLFPEDGPTREGPRLQDLTVSASSYGDAIKIGYGTVRMNGNIIWSTGLREQQNTETVGGKGMGGNASTVSYQYFASWAAAFAEGPAEAVIRIWFDTHLVYDATNTRDLFSKRPFTFRFYPGDEDQLPDPAIEAHVGTESATAHRGICYVVFDDVLLQDYGNRIPNITAEIAFKTTALYPIESLDMGPFASLLRPSVYPDWERELLFAWGTDTDGDRRIGVWDSTSLELLYSRKVEDIVGYEPELMPGANLFAMPDGYLYASTEEYGNDSADPYDLVKVEPNSLTMVARLEYPDGPESRPEYGGGCAALNSDGTYDYFFALTDAFGTEWTMFRCEPFHRLGSYNVVNKIGPMLAAEPRIGLAGLYVFGNHTTLGGDVHVIKFTFAPGFSGDPPVATWRPSMSTVDTWVENVDLAGTFDNMDGAFAFRFEDWFYVAVPGDTNNYLVKWNEENGIADTLTFPSSAWAAGAQGFANNNVNVEGGVLLFPTAETGPGGISYTKVTKIDLASFTVVDFLDGDPFPQEFSGFWSASYDGGQHKILTAGSGGFTNAWYERSDGDGVPLSVIVSNLCLRAGLAAEQIDVSELTDTVRGYALTRQATVRTAIEQLALGFFFDGVESDGKLKFLKRGRSPWVNIQQKDLGAERDDDYWPETRIQETELPRRFSLTYMDFDRDYQEGTQHSRRMVVPTPTMDSRDEQTVQLPIVWSASEAKQIAERWLYTLWLERSSHRTLLGPRYLRLDPADVITVTLDDGAVHTVRIGTVDVGAGFSIAIDARQEDAALYVSTAVGDGGSGMPEDVVVIDQPTELFVLDTPLLRDVDDLGGRVSRYYLAAGVTRRGTVWPGAAIYRSQDDGVGELRAVANSGASWGYVVGILGDTASPFAPDADNSITVRMIAGGDTLASITDAELVNGGNPALVGDEIIQFRDVTDNGDGTYTLSYLLRGRRGTDVFTGSHVPAERILILDAATLQADSVELGLLDQTLWWRAATDGRSLSSVEPEALPLTGRDLKPYAPVQASRADMAGDIVLSWQRRTRIGGAWRDGTGVAPLSEQSEAYEVDIFDDAGGSVLRTLTSGTNSVTYAAADVIADFGSAPAELHVRITQISAVVGRGFYYEWKLRDGEPGERVSGGE